ncbi:MAG TPA: DNA-formamidopyrimidine glycosylase family protein [Galbitalea sp.]|jgi:endonuclease-8|nr:DNA-formamidopyrimidine glycosylase family protein [Galbitalea sp.]
MPEGDTVFRTARVLNDAMAGRVLDRCDLRIPAFATVDLTGERVESVTSVGKHLLHRIGEFTMHSHLKMEGSWEVYAAGTPWRHPAWQARAVLGVSGTLAVGFQLGELEVVPREREHEVVGYLGPDLLGDTWDLDLAASNLTADSGRPVGLALLDQRVMAGLGNVYRNEVCFLRGVLPTRPVGEVSDPAGLARLAQRMILANRDRVERTTTGDLRRGRRTWVHGRENEPCLRCGTPIRRGSLGDTELTARQTFFCPTCQA